MNNPRLFLIHCMLCVFLIFVSCSSDSVTLKVSQSTLRFDDVNLSESKSLTVTLTNKYSSVTTITNVSLSDTTNYSITSTLNTPIDLAKNETFDITIKFEPTSDGVHEAVLMITHNNSTRDKIVNLNGTGVPAPRISLSTTNVPFGKFLLSTKVSYKVEVENTGTANLTLSSLQITGTGAGAFSLTSGGSTPVTIVPGAIHGIIIQFLPTSATTYAASLDVNHDGINETSPIVVSLSGEGVLTAPEMTVDPATPWDFGLVGVGISFLQKLKITNSGTDTLTVTSAAFASNNGFTIAGYEDAQGNSINLPKTVAIGAKIYILIEFAPIAVTNYNDTLSIVHDGVNVPSPYDMALKGSGKSAVSQTFSYSGSIVSWTVPAGVNVISLEAWGAQGGINDAMQVGGWGAQMKGMFAVTPGDTLKILVGEQGEQGSTASWSRCGGGSGGTFVWKDGENMPMIVAGGGGGKGYLNCSNSMDASITTSGVQGKHPGGTNGNGGTGGTVLSDDGAGGGGGWLSDGTGLYPGLKIYNGTGAGGVSTYNDGGFGGGGGSSNSAGGGGGYSGGGGGFYGFNTNPQYNGGGGGSYNAGTNQSNSVGNRAGDGYLEIKY